MKYGSGLSGKSKLKLGMAALAVLVAVVALAGPGRGKVMALVGQGDPEGVSPAQAETFGRQSLPGEEGDDADGDQDPDGEDSETEDGQDDAEGDEGEGSEDDGDDSETPGGSGEVASLPASAAIDEDNETGAGIPWLLDDPQPAGLILTLEEPMRVDHILIAPGLPDSVEDGPLVLRPKLVRVRSDTGSSDEISLDDSTSLQKQTLDLGEGVSTLTLTVLEVHVPDHKTYDMAVIGEIRVD